MQRLLINVMYNKKLYSMERLMVPKEILKGNVTLLRE